MSHPPVGFVVRDHTRLMRTPGMFITRKFMPGTRIYYCDVITIAGMLAFGVLLVTRVLPAVGVPLSWWAGPIVIGVLVIAGAVGAFAHRTRVADGRRWTTVARGRLARKVTHLNPATGADCTPRIIHLTPRERADVT